MDLQLGLSLGGVSSSLSSLLASILYQTNLGDFVYRTDENGNVILDNQGGSASTYDGLLYSGRGIELGALNDVTVGDAAKWTTYFDFATATHVKAFGVQVLNTKTINSILVSANEPSAETLSIFDANPNLVGKLAKSATGTIPEVDFTLVVGDEYYMCAEPSLATLYDARSAKTITITNYVETIRSNADLQSKGIQTTAFVTDGAGVPTSYSSNLLQFNGDSRYVDTQWVTDFSKEFTILLVQEANGDGTNRLNGQGVFGTSMLRIGQAADNKISVYANSSLAQKPTAITISGLHHIAVVNTITSLKLYVDGIYMSEISLAGVINPIIPFYLGGTNGQSFPLTGDLGFTKLHKYKAFTATEVATAYAQAKLIYPTLP